MGYRLQEFRVPCHTEGKWPQPPDGCMALEPKGMTVSDLILNVLGAIRRRWYAGREAAFHRDKQALTKSIARYGFECTARGWCFEPLFIQRDLEQLLTEIQRSKVEIVYLPVYLEGAVDRHIRLRAEELSSAAKAVSGKVSKIVRGVERVDAVVERRPVEILAALYQDLGRRQRRARRARRARPKDKEGVLL